MIDSIRVAAMEAIFFNLTGARFQLPHGGYGLTGVCNDSAAMIQYALFGKNDGKSLKKSVSRQRCSTDDVYSLSPSIVAVT